MVVTRDYVLDEDEAGLVNHGGGKIRDLFWNGTCRKGTRLRLRIAHPSYWSDEVKTPTLFHLIELAIDDKFIVRLKGERDPSEEFDAESFRPKREKLYPLYCSPSLIPGDTSSRRTPIHLASVTDLATLTCESAVEYVDSDVAREIVICLERRFQEIISEVLNGLFYIGAVREPHNYLSLDELDEKRDWSTILRRHVGMSGEHSWIFERNLHSLWMRDVGELRFAREDFYQTPVQIVSPASQKHFPKISRIWEMGNLGLKSELAKALEERHSEYLGVDEFGEPDVVDVFGNHSEEEFTNLVVELLNRLLDEPQLFEFNTWAEDPGQLYGETGEEPLEVVDPYISDPEIKYLSELGPEDLSQSQLRRLNYLLIEDAFSDYVEDGPILLSSETYQLGSYVSTWMQHLTDAKPTDRARSPWPALIKNANEPWSGLSQTFPELVEPSGLLLAGNENLGRHGARSNELRCTHPCFGVSSSKILPQPPRQLSAGFHQIFPIIVQLGLMRAGELVGIENPEVHLHPALQLRLTEALIAHIRSGRRMVIETTATS